MSDDQDYGWKAISRAIAGSITGLSQPIPLVALIILVSVIVLIGANLLGMDKGSVLDKLKDGEYARGLITYLFAVGTIGAVVILILAALTGTGETEERDARFDKAKEIFSLLIGIFGTIIGFYFGSIKAEEETQGTTDMAVAAPLVPDTVAAGQPVSVISNASGGSPPYLYSVGFGPTAGGGFVKRSQGWIREELPAPAVSKDSAVNVYVHVEDVAGDSVTAVQQIVVRPRSGRPPRILP
jgi:uncharacterized membrane protein